MKRARIAVAVLLLAGVAWAQQKPPVKPNADASQLAGQVRKLWEAFQQKDKATLSAMLDDGFRLFE